MTDHSREDSILINDFSESLHIALNVGALIFNDFQATVTLRKFMENKVHEFSHIQFISMSSENLITLQDRDQKRIKESKRPIKRSWHLLPYDFSFFFCP